MIMLRRRKLGAETSEWKLHWSVIRAPPITEVEQARSACFLFGIIIMLEMYYIDQDVVSFQSITGDVYKALAINLFFQVI